MRFCDLFISYKFGLKDIKSTIPFTKLPLYRKIFIIILSVLLSLSLIFILFNQTFYSHVSIAVFIFLFYSISLYNVPFYFRFQLKHFSSTCTVKGVFFNAKKSNKGGK